LLRLKAVFADKVMQIIKWSNPKMDNFGKIMKLSWWWNHPKDYPHPFKDVTVGQHSGNYNGAWAYKSPVLMAMDDFGDLVLVSPMQKMCL
jgi:hypothetical protein